MDRKLAAILFISLALNLFSASIPVVRGWDETVYAGLGWNLKTNPLDYSFEHFLDRNFDCKECAGFRAPLLPYLLMLVFMIGGSNQTVLLLMPIIGTATVGLTYLLAKRLFDGKTALYSAFLIATLPLFVFYSGRMLTGVLTTCLLCASVLTFWLGFVEDKKTFRIACGFFTALSILARYTAVWILPAYLLFMIIKRKLEVLKEPSTIACGIVFLLVLAPWLWYSHQTYGTPLGSLLHAQKAAGYWGGEQPWYFFLEQSPVIFSATAFLFIFGLYSIYKNREAGKNGNLLLLLWFSAIILFCILMPHKEERFLLPLTPPLAIIAAIGLRNTGRRENVVLGIIAVLLMVSLVLLLGYSYVISRTPVIYCFLEANDFIGMVEGDAITFSYSSPQLYFYTHRDSYLLQDLFWQTYPIIEKNYSGKPVYIFWSMFDNAEYTREDFERNSKSKLVYECPEDGELAAVYAYRN